MSYLCRNILLPQIRRSLPLDGCLQSRTEIQQCLENTQDIEEKLALEGEDWVHNHRGELQTYRKLDGGERYILGLIK